MSTVKRLELWSVEAYLEHERKTPTKHEYVGGILHAMGGASDSHNRVAVNLVARLYEPSRANGCQVYVSDMKVRTLDDRFYYPDVMVVCGDDPETYYKTQPCLLVEILSPSTASIDRREKLNAYLALPSLLTYLLVNPEARRVEGYLRTSQGWQVQVWEDEGEVPVACLETSLTLSDIYAGLEPTN